MGLRSRSIDRNQYPHPDTVMVPLVLSSTITGGINNYHSTGSLFTDGEGAVAGGIVEMNQGTTCHLTPQSIFIDGVGSVSGAIDTLARFHGEDQFGNPQTEDIPIQNVSPSTLKVNPAGCDTWGIKPFRKVFRLEWLEVTTIGSGAFNIGIHSGDQNPYQAGEGPGAMSNVRYGTPFRLSEPGIGGASTPEPTAEILEVLDGSNMAVNPNWKIDTENNSIYLIDATGLTGRTLFLKMRVPFKRDM